MQTAKGGPWTRSSSTPLISIVISTLYDSIFSSILLMKNNEAQEGHYPSQSHTVVNCQVFPVSFVYHHVLNHDAVCWTLISLHQNIERIACILRSQRNPKNMLFTFTFVVVLSQFQVSKCPTSSFGFSLLQYKHLQNCPFAKPDTINEIIPHPSLISIR